MEPSASKKFVVVGIVAALLLAAIVGYGVIKRGQHNANQRLEIAIAKWDSLSTTVEDDKTWGDRFVALMNDTAMQKYVQAYGTVAGEGKDFIRAVDNLLLTLEAEQDLSNTSLVDSLMIKRRMGEELEIRIWNNVDAMLSVAPLLGMEKNDLQDSISFNAFYPQDVARRESKKNWNLFNFQGASVGQAKAFLIGLKINAVESKRWIFERLYQKATTK